MNTEAIIEAAEKHVDFLMSGVNVALFLDSEMREVRRFAGGGEDLNVSLSPGEVAELRGTVGFHTHMYDAPFGPSCLAEVMKFDYGVGVIMTPGYVFVLERPEDGWPVPPVIPGEFDFDAFRKAVEFAQAAVRMQKEVMADLGIPDDAEELDDDTALRLRRVHTQRLADFMGAKYTEHQRTNAEV